MKTFPTQLLLQLTFIIPFNSALLVSDSEVNDLFFQIVTRDFYLHFSHNLSPASMTSQHIDKVVTWYDQNER